MAKSASGAKVFTFPAAAALAILLAAITGQPWAWTAAAILAVAAGIFFTRSRASSGEPVARVAEMSADQLVRLQETAQTRGLRSISATPVGPHLDQSRKHFAIVQPSLRDKARRTEVLRCIAVLYLNDGSCKVGELEIDPSDFESLVKIDDRKRAEGIIKSHAGAPIYVG